MKVLLVEDDVALAASVARGLGHQGFTVDLATDGDDGWWMATEGTYDVLVLDIMVPKRNGFALCRDLRAAGVWTPVVMLTAKSGDHDQVEALDLGADDYVTKPFSFPVLVARMHSATRRAARRREVPAAVGVIHLDSARREVAVCDVPIELTTREFDVLEFLVRADGRVVSKESVLAGVWAYDFDGDPNIVEVYVGRLRRKLRAAAGDDVIRTVRGVGYRIDHERP